MSRRTSSFSIILVFICLMLTGITMVPLLPVKLSPSHALPQVSVYFSMPGNSPRVVEMEATSKLESMLSRVKGVQNIWSVSGNGWGNIGLRLDKHVNIDAARFEISTIIRQAWPLLPKEVGYPSISMSRSDENANRPFMTYTINAPASPVFIKEFTENQIKPKLSTIEGVNRIRVSGAMPMEWKVEYDYKQLQTLGITVEEIQTAISQSLSKENLGTVSTGKEGDQSQWIRIALAPEEIPQGTFDVSNIQVKAVNGKIVSLDELVTVSHIEQQPQSYYRINGLNSIYLSIVADEHANQLDLGKKIREQLSAMKEFFPAGYEVHQSYDATEYLRDELEKIYYRTGLTLMILLLFVLLIYRNLKYLLLITVSLVVNIAIAVIFYYLSGLEIQLYSMAGITISLTLIIDNTIVMSDQIIRRNNKKAFLAILAATVTTIASLVIIFFLDEKVRLNLQDFASIIMINLGVSLLVALFLVPALLEKLNIKRRHRKNYPKLIRLPRRKRMLVYFNRCYGWLCRVIWRWCVVAITALILTFGLPVFLLPEKIEKEGSFAELYNKVIGNATYKEKYKTKVDKYLGGTLRLFVQRGSGVGSFIVNREETSLFVTASLPNGSTITQMNQLVQRMESYISQSPGVKMFQTSIQSALRANIYIYFAEESLDDGLPFMLKSNLIIKANELGGGSWGVYGLGDNFNNNVREQAGSFRVEMFGFNYDELNDLANRFKDKLIGNRRIKEVVINSEFSYYKDDYQEFVFDLNKEQLAKENIQPVRLFSSLKPMFGQNIYAGQVAGPFGNERIVLSSIQWNEYDVWGMEHIPGKTGEREYKLSGLARITKTQAPQKIAKEDQQYKLCLQFEYLGDGEQGRKLVKRYIDEFRTTLPLGYTIEEKSRYDSWEEKGEQYWLLFLILVIIYFSCSVLFNSMKQPFSVICVVPIAYIGVFLTFNRLELGFNQGGFAALVLLCGISINANIYILNEYNNIIKNRNIPPLKAYIKAWNAKISPIFLTVVSTMLGFIPFIIGHREAFWYPLAVGTIGGLAMSLIGTFLFLPLFMSVGRKRKVK